jgi:hypothetical protein
VPTLSQGVTKKTFVDRDGYHKNGTRVFAHQALGIAQYDSCLLLQFICLRTYKTLPVAAQE